MSVASVRRVGHGPRHDYGLVRRPRSAALWAFVFLFGRWFGIEVRWDPEIMGSKVMWTVADQSIGWLE